MAKKKKYFIWIIIFAAIVAGGYFYLNSKKPKTTYTTQEVKRGTLSQTVSVTGKLFSETEINLSFMSGGEVSQVFVEVGDTVKIGQKLAEISKDSLLNQLALADKDIAYQKKILEDMRSNKSTYGSNRREAQVQLVRKAQDARNGILIGLRDNAIYSPIDGLVIARNYEPGENVSPNATLLKIVDPRKMEIQSNVPESDIVKIQVGQSAKVAFDALPSDEILQAKVTEIDPASTVIQDVVYYQVRFKLDNLDSRLKIGMSEDVDILTASKEKALMIPLRAVKTEGADKYVEIIKDEINNVTEKIKITTGLEGDDGMIEVATGDLKEGDRVITLVNSGK